MPEDPSPNSQATPTPTSNQPARPEVDFYTWKVLFKSLLPGLITHEERLGYLRARDEKYEKEDCERCETHVEALFRESPIVRFLREEIQRIGPDLNQNHVHCRRCSLDKSGGFDLNYGILICANENVSRERVEDTLAHEMVHAYDHARWNIDRNNMKHQACTEVSGTLLPTTNFDRLRLQIRASTLSGECRFWREFWGRGQYRLTKQFQECIRRRAVLSMRARPQIKDAEHARKVVNDVWGSCFVDTRPFDQIFK